MQWPGDESDLEAMIEGKNTGNEYKIMAMRGDLGNSPWTLYCVKEEHEPHKVDQPRLYRWFS